MTKNKKRKDIQKNNIKLAPPQILVLVFIVAISIGTILLDLPIASKNGQSIGLINALFTATSAACVTGLAVVDTISYWTPFGKTVIFILIQIGSLGFMVITTLFFLFTGKRITLKERVLLQSFLNHNKLSGVVRFIKYIFIFTICIEGIGALLLSFRFIPIYGFLKGLVISAFYANSAFSNSGFDFIGEFPSLIPFTEDVIINLTIMTLIVIGGLGFSVVQELIEHKKLHRISTHSKLVLTMTAGLVVFGAFVIFILERNNPATLKNLSFQGKILSTLFHSISPRTAGFYTLDIADFTTASKFFTILLMFIGGSPGSTAGGVKTATIGILVVAVISVLKGQDDTEIFRRRVENNLIRKALAIVMIGFFIIVAVTMILSITEQATFMEILFETVSAFGTAGLSMGITSELSIIGRIVIIFTMFIGRVGPLTLGIAITRRQAEYNKGNYRYPKGDIIVG